MSGHAASPSGAQSARLVRAWVACYTRSTPAAAGEARRAELASDLWEQVHDPRSAGVLAGPVLLWRAARGVPSDLAWRRAAKAGQRAGRPPLHLRWERSGLVGVMAAEGVLVGTAMLGIAAHVIRGGGAGSLGTTTAGVLAALAAGALLAAAGLGLLLRARTRWLAPIALGVGAVILLRTGLPALTWISTTVAAAYYGSPLLWTRPGWDEVGALALLLVVVLHAAVLVAWWPARLKGALR